MRRCWPVGVGERQGIYEVIISIFHYLGLVANLLEKEISANIRMSIVIG